MAAPNTPDTPLATRDEIRRLEDLIAGLRRTIDGLVRDRDIQFKRIAQLQADIDVVRGAWSKLPTASETPSPKARKYTGPERRLVARKK